MKKLTRWWYRFLKKSPAKMPMVKYWRFKEAVQAKVMLTDKGYIMRMEGEDYDFPTYPRGHLLFGNLSKLKHEIKQLFNEAWWRLEDHTPDEVVIQEFKQKLFFRIPPIFESLRYDMLPPEKMCPSVREIYRAWTKVAPESTFQLRDWLCFILQEDDAYRFRVQWLVGWFGWFYKLNPKKAFERSLKSMEVAEIVGDMKVKIRLLRRILMLGMKDKTISTLFEKFFREVDWKKVKLTKADKYHFRGKYFKVDLDKFEY